MNTSLSKTFKHTKLKALVLALGSVAFCQLPMPALASTTEAQLFEEVDPALELQRLTQKYAEDKERLSLAVANTKDLIRKSQSKGYLPELYLRLAELYIEMSRIAYMQVRILQGPSKSEFSALESHSYKVQAIEIYQRILNVYPKFLERDKVFFYLAHEFRELSRDEEMLAAYAQLIEESPNSPLTPEALLLTGDYWFRQGDPNKSRAYYERVITYEGNPATVIARYKLAWTHINLKEFDQAVKLLIESVTDANTLQERDVDTYSGIDIRLESLVDLAFIYPDAFKDAEPRHAIELFRSLSWSRTAYLSVLEKTASRLRVRKHWPRTLEVYRELIKLENDPEVLITYAHRLFEAYQHINEHNMKGMPGNESDIQMLVRTLRLQAAAIEISDEVKAESEASIETYTRDIATSIHQRAKSSDLAEDYARAALAYESYLSWFDDTPNTMEMQLNLADSLYNSGELFRAALAYEKASQHPQMQGNQLGEMLYSALHAYQSALKSDEPMNHLHTLQARSGLVATGERYLASFPASKHSRDVEFNIAWVRYDEGKFDEAIEGFTAFLHKYPTGETASAAVELVIDSYQVNEDWDGLSAFTKTAMAIPGLPQKDKAELQRLTAAAQEKIVSQMTIAALDDWDNGADNMLDFVNSSGDSALGAQVLGSLMALSQEKHDLRTLNMATDKLLASAPQSEDSKNGVKMMIDASLKSGHFRMLQENLQRYAQLYPSDADSKEFLLQAARIQQQLGMSDQAVQTYGAYRQKYNISGAESAEIAMRMAEAQIDAGDSRDAEQTLLNARRSLSPAQRADIDGLVGLMLLKRGQDQLVDQIAKSITPSQTSNGQTNRRLAQLKFGYVDKGLRSYKSLNLSKGIDAAIVQRKTAQLQQLTQAYQLVLSYKAPKWSVATMYRLAELNNEYARFLMEAPIPEQLSDAEKQQYRDLIAQQAAPYQQEAQKYLDAAQDVVTRLGLSGEELNAIQNGQDFDTDVAMMSYSKGRAVTVEKSLEDDTLYELHQQLIVNRDNETALMMLTQAYFERGDLGQALMLATQFSGEQSPAMKSRLLSIAGVIHFEQGNIDSAQAAFSQANDVSGSNLSAIANLAAIHAENGDKAQADQLFRRLPADWQVPAEDYLRISWLAKYYKEFRQEVAQP